MYTFRTYKDVYPMLDDEYTIEGNVECNATYYGKPVTILGFGSTRVALLDGDTVIKVCAPWTSYANINEYETWRLVRNTPYARHLVPVLSISVRGNVLRMPYAGKVLTSLDYEARHEVLTRLSRALSKMKSSGVIRRSVVEDLHTGNITADGRLLDYG